MKMPSNHSNGNSSLEIAQSNQDLIITKGKKKKRAWIIGTIIGLIVIAVVIALVVVLTSNRKETTPEAAISLEDILEGRLSPKSYNATWVSGNKLFYKAADGAVVLYNIEDGSTEVLLPGSTEAVKNAFNFELSPDRRFLLIAHDYQKLYRYTYYARYTMYDLQNNEEYSLGSGDTSLQYASWGTVGNSVVYVFNNNIYYKQTALSDAAFQVTNDGRQDSIYNGIPDWVYEEEVFGSNHAIWFSPDGKKLAYAKFNDNTTSVMTLPFYGIPGSLDSQYTRLNALRYPKPGSANPGVSLHVCNLVTSSTINLEVPSGLRGGILTAVGWATNTTLVPVWMNRVQNESYVVAYDTASTATSTNHKIIKHLKEENGWLDIFTAPIFSQDGSQMLLILSQDQGNGAGSFRHITRFEMVENSDPEAITSGKFVVTQILGWNENRSLIYYQANTEDPAVQHVYSISTTTKAVTCISCGIKTTLKNEKCLYNSAKFSKDFSHYVLNCAGPGFPEISIFSSDNKRLLVWENNEDLMKALGVKSLPKMQRLVFDVADGFKGQVYLKLPPNIDMSGNTKYPMLVNVYGGPDSYQVIERFSLDWGSYLATNKSIIYATIDGRGSGLKGDNILFSIYRRLGTVEIEDQINVTRQIQQTIPYVDGTRTAIWGWSYGGYSSGLALATDKENVFKCGMSVAPVTDWTLYDSIYTERFMGLPTLDDNIVGYENAKLLNKYEGMRNKEYFLIHGTFDDNVHYQQSMLWSKVLEHQDIMFRQQSYPDEDHGLGSVRPHLYHSLENFLDECFIENV